MIVSRYSRMTVLALAIMPELVLAQAQPNASRPVNFSRPAAAPLSVLKPKREMPSLPVTFEKNQGQFHGSVRYISRREGLTVAVLDTEVLFSLRSRAGAVANVKMKLAGGNPAPVITGEMPAGLRSNYLMGQDPGGWTKNVASFQRVRLASVYPGIDMLFHGAGGEPEFDFEVAPGADPTAIRYRFEGADGVTIDAAGDVSIRAAGQEFRQRKPDLYQTVANHRQDVAGRYFARHDGSIGFAVGPYDRSAALIVDPQMLFSKTFGAFGANTSAFAVGPGDAMYIVGSLPGGAILDPAASSSKQGAASGSSATFVANLDHAGNALWVTYLGGSGYCTGQALAVDSSGSVYVVGQTASLDFPTTANAFQKQPSGTPVFAAKLDSTGANLLYSTFLGGVTSPNDAFIPASVALDASGDLIVAGASNSTTLPGRAAGGAQPFQTKPAGDFDVFLAKFNADGSNLLFLTYLGGTGGDYVSQMIQDGDGNFILTGYTPGKNFPTTGAGVTTQYGGGSSDAFVAKINSTGTALIFSTYLGGAGSDMAHGLALTAQNEILVAGETSSTNFPVLKAYEGVYNGGPRDGFVTKLDANGVVNLSTYVGTAGDDYIATIAAQSDGLILMTFLTDSTLTGAVSREPHPLDADNGNTYTLAADNPNDLQNQMQQYNFSFPSNGSPQTCGFFPITDPADIAQGYISYYCCAGYVNQSGNTLPAQACLITSASNSNNGVPDFLAQQDGGQCCDPVSTGTGEVTASEPDLPRSGPLSLHLERFYASQMNNNGFSGALGTNWMHNYEQRLSVNGTSAVVTLFPGRQIAFAAAGAAWQVAATEKYNYQLAAAGAGFQFSDPQELRIYTFTAGGQLTGIADRNGNTLTVTQSSNGPASVSDGLGRTITFTYDSTGHLVKAQDQAGRTLQYTYTGADLILVTDVLGQKTRYQYATGGIPSLLAAKTYPGGNIPNQQQFDGSGKIVSQTSASANTTTFAYAAGNATTVTDALGSKYTQTVSNRGALTSSVDNSGQATTMVYDQANHRTSTTSRLGLVSSVGYDASGGAPAAFTDPRGNVTMYSYTTQSQNGFTYRVISQVTYADGSIRSLTYDPKGNVLSIADPDGGKTTFAYETHGWMTSTTNPLGGITTLIYNSDGTAASIALPSGDTEKYTYDSRKRLAKTTFADGAQRSYTYNDLDQVLTTTNENGDTRTSQFGFNNALSQQSDYAGNSSNLLLDSENRLSSLVDRTGNTTLLNYDNAGRVKSGTTPAGYQATRNYDALGRTTSVSDAGGTVVSSVYDKDGRIVSTLDGAGRAVNFTYDAAGNVTKVGNDAYSATMTFDKLNRVSSVTDGAGIATTYSYTHGGHLAGVKQGAIGVSLVYDAQGNLTSAADPNGNPWTFGRDPMGRVVSRKDPAGNTQTLQYDSRQRISGIALPDGSVSFGFDSAGRLLSQTYSDKTQLNFTYDKTGALLTANGAAFAYDAEGRLTGSNGIVIARDAAGRIASLTYGPGLTVTYSYNKRNLVSHIGDWKGGGADLTYDAGNQLATISRSNGVVTTIGVDSAGRTIAIADGSLASIQATRDAAGNVTASNRNLPAAPSPAGGTLSMAYDAASQLAAGKYDGEGRLTSDSQRSYTWDMASRLISYSGAGGSASFSYDANGMMLSQSGSGGTRQYVANYVFGLPAVAIVRDGNSQDLRYYVPLPGGASLYSMEASGGARHFFHYDEAGNTTFLTDDTGAVTDSYGITPYGESVVHTGASDNPFTFQGAAGAMQVESALYYMRARFYDGGSGRFISRDLVTRNTLPLRINPYQYAEGNPLTKFDPSGADATTQLLDQQFGTRSQWDTFQTQIAQYYVGQQVVQQVIQQAFADAAAQNGAWWNFWATPVDPAALAASRLQALLGNSFSIGDGFSDLPYITQLYNATNSGDLNGMAQAFNSLLGTSATTLIGQDAEALVAQANGVTLLGGNNSGTSLPPDAQHWINQALAGVVSNDGGSVVSHDGGTVVSNDGGSFANLLMGVVSHDGGTVVSHDGGTVVSHDGGTVVSHDGGTLFGNGGSTFSFRIGN